MDILFGIIGIVVIVFIRYFFFIIVQLLIAGAWSLISGIFGFIFGSSSDRPSPRPEPRPSYDPPPRLRPRPMPSPSPRSTGRVDEFGVDSSWTKEQKRAHLLREYAKYNARMQILKDKWLRDDCQRRLEAITRAIMALNRQGDM